MVTESHASNPYKPVQDEKAVAEFVRILSPSIFRGE
jgi:hypothetical protein